MAQDKEIKIKIDTKVPVKGVDYFTPEDIDDIKDKVVNNNEFRAGYETQELVIKLDARNPVKGKDYFTENDIAQVVELVKDRIPTPEDGKSPVRGEDYFTDADVSSMVADILSQVQVVNGKDGKDGVTPTIDHAAIAKKVMGKIQLPKDGKDGSPDTATDIVSKLTALPQGQRLSYDWLDDLPNLATFRGKLGTTASRDYDLAELKDVTLTNPTNGQVLSYNSTFRKWINAAPSGGGGGGTWGSITGTLSDQTDLQTALDAKANLASPIFTGDPQAPTAPLGDNDTSLATTAFVQQALLSGTANALNLEVYVRNQTGSTIPIGSIVYINGATGNRPTITLAQADNDANSAQTFGFTKSAIVNNGFGYAIVRGELENIDTSALTEGAQLYLSPTTAGTWTTTKPLAPQHLVYVGICIRAHPTLGVIIVAIQNGYELYELHDVSITTPTNGQVLKYDAAQALWVNSTDSTGVAWGAITGTLSAQTDLQTALDTKVDENVAITGATKTKITYDAKGLVTAGADATTADIADSSNKRYVTDADLVDIGNLSGTNSGDNAANTTSNTYADAKVADAINDGTTTIAPSQNAVFDALALKAPLASPTFTGTVTVPVALTGVLRADTGVVSVDSDVTDIVAAGTSSAAGKLELATDAETVTGTDTARAVTPANLVAKMAAPGAIGGTTAAAITGTTITATTSVTTVDEAYNATTWNGNNTVPTKNAIRDKIETMGGGSGITRTVTSIAVDTTAGSAASTDYVYFVTGTTTLTLPTAVGNTNRYTVKSISGTTTVDGGGAETIDGAANIGIANEDSVDLVSNGTEWKVV